MVNKQKVPYDKVVLALMAVLLLAGLIVPSATGYVNNPSTDFDKDMQTSIILENAVVRLVDNGELLLSGGLTSDIVEARIKRVLGSIPEINQKGNSYCLNIKNGKVNIKKVKQADEIVINNISGD